MKDILTFNKVPVVPVIRLFGAIGMGGRLKSGFDFAGVVAAIEKAFAINKAMAVALVINSPGGSPAQSSLIYKRITQLKQEKEKPVFAFVEDAAASGGYYIACAADKIYCDESSILGSIGVVSAGFGFTEAIGKLGVERRVHTAGENKSILDPFQPEKEEDIQRLKNLQLEIHQTFKGVVRTSRGDRLADDPDLFTGAFWAGEQAVARGLADGIGDMRSILRGEYGDKVKLKVMPTGEKSWIARRLGMSSLPGGLADGLAEDVVATAKMRALWARMGL